MLLNKGFVYILIMYKATTIIIDTAIIINNSSDLVANRIIKAKITDNIRIIELLLFKNEINF